MRFAGLKDLPVTIPLDPVNAAPDLWALWTRHLLTLIQIRLWVCTAQVMATAQMRKAVTAEGTAVMLVFLSSDLSRSLSPLLAVLAAPAVVLVLVVLFGPTGCPIFILSLV